MLALATDLVDEPQAVQATYLQRDGSAKAHVIRRVRPSAARLNPPYGFLKVMTC